MPERYEENGCWAGGCIGGPLGGVLVPVAWYFAMIRDGIDFDLIASFAAVFSIVVGIVSGIVLGSVLGSIVYRIRRKNR